MAITKSGSTGSVATVEARPGDTVTVPTIVIRGSYLSVAGFYVNGAPNNDGGVIFAPGATHDTLRHTDVSEAAPNRCGQAVRLLGINGGTHTSFITIASNRIHDTGSGCQADAIYMQGWDHVTVTQNAIYHIDANQALCGGNCHQDTLQSYLAGIPTTGLTVTRNYVHDTAGTQGLPFLADGDIASGVNISNNLETRMVTTGPQTGMQIGINSVAMIIRNNTYWGGTVSNVNAVGATPSPSLELDHNLFNDFEMETNGSTARYPGLSESYNIFRHRPWSWAPRAIGDRWARPRFMCSRMGPHRSSICGNGTAAGDDYRLAVNPHGIGIDWAPAQYRYGPQVETPRRHKR